MLAYHEAHHSAIALLADAGPRMAELVARYADMALGTVDASVVTAAERLGIATIATLDRRHFGAVRPSRVDAFHLPPN